MDKKQTLSSFSQLRELGREMARTKGRGGTVLAIGAVLFLIFFFLGIGAGLFSALMNISEETMNLALELPMKIIEFILIAMMIPLQFAWARKEELGFKDFWKKPDWRKVAHLILVSLIILLVVSLGLVFLVVPGIYLGLRLSFAQYAIMDKGLGAFDALKYSWKITKGQVWHLFLFHLYFGLFNILGFLCLIIGAVWTGTMHAIATAKLYYELSELAEKSESKPELL